MTGARRPDPADVLSTAHLEEGLGERTANGALIALGGQVLKTALSLTSAVVLARLLSPEDFGLVAMAAAFTGFCWMFADLGLSTATVQRKEIDQSTVSALFYVSVGAGALIALFAVATAPIVAHYYGDPRIGPVAASLAVPIVLFAASAQHRAVMQRAMRWSALQRIDLGSQVVAMLLAVALAWGTSLGYWALVAQAWTGAGVALILTWHTCRWRPGRVADWAQARGAIGLGLNLTGFSFVNYFHRQFDNVLIGWRWGPVELGYYTRAYTLLLLPLNLINGPTSSAVLPALSRLQHDPARWRELYLVALSAVVLVSAPLTALLIAAAKPLIAVLFGPAWSQSAHIFQCLAISMFAATPLNTTGWIHVSMGRADRMFRWSIVATPVIVVAYFIGVPYGTASLALAYSIAMWVIAIPGMAFAVHGTALSLADTLRVSVPLTGAGIVSAVAGSAIAGAMESAGASPAVALLAIGAGTGAVYALIAGGLVIRLAAYAPLRHHAGAWLGATLARRIPNGAAEVRP